MIFKYGVYAHDQNEVMIRISQQGIFDTFNRRMGEVIEWTILGVLQVAYNSSLATMQNALTAKMAALRAAYNSDYQDWKVYLDDGVTETNHVVLNSAVFGGTKVVVPPSWLNGPWTGRTEYAQRRTYQIVLRAETRVGTGLHTWRERITIKGTGAAKWRYSPQESGDAQAQTLQTNTTFWYIQEGEAVGRTAYPTPSAVLYPGIEHADMRVISYETPRDMVVGGNEMYGVSWKYFMEATVSQGFSAFTLPGIT